MNGSVYVDIHERATGTGFGLVLPFPPFSGNNQYVGTGKGKVLRPEMRAWRVEVLAAGRKQLGKDWKALGGDLVMLLIIDWPDRRKRDTTNLRKVVEDALQPWAILDDHQIKWAHDSQIERGKAWSLK